MILVDTSVWVDHLRRGNDALIGALEEEIVLTHPFVVGELACGDLRRREDFLGLLDSLPIAMVATDTEALLFIERHRVMGKGIGYVDVHLLTSVALTAGSVLWTLDKRLASVAAAIA